LPFGGYGLALAALALVLFGAYDSYPTSLRNLPTYWSASIFEVSHRCNLMRDDDDSSLSLIATVQFAQKREKRSQSRWMTNCYRWLGWRSDGAANALHQWRATRLPFFYFIFIA